MIVVEYLLGTLQVQVVLSIFAPGQSYERLQIGELHVELRTLGIQVVELVGFLVEGLVHFGRPFLQGSLLQQFVFLGRRLTVSHLSLHVLDLLLEEVVTLLLVDVLTGLVADVSLQVLEVDLAVDQLHDTKQTLFHRLFQQQLHLIVEREGHVRADEVEGHDVVVDILDGKRSLVGDVF